jgi:predicted aspartyl protease
MLRFRYQRWLTYRSARPRHWFVRILVLALPFLPGTFPSLFGTLGRGKPGPSSKPNSDMRPIVTVSVQGPSDSLQLEALIDTGSVATIVSREVADAIGVKLQGSEDAIVRWRGRRYSVEYQTVRLHLRQGGITWTWDAQVAFSSAEVGIALLGQKGFLDYLDAKFYGALQVVELETNTSFAGNISSSNAGA